MLLGFILNPERTHDPSFKLVVRVVLFILLFDGFEHDMLLPSADFVVRRRRYSERFGGLDLDRGSSSRNRVVADDDFDPIVRQQESTLIRLSFGPRSIKWERIILECALGGDTRRVEEFPVGGTVDNIDHDGSVEPSHDQSEIVVTFFHQRETHMRIAKGIRMVTNS